MARTHGWRSAAVLLTLGTLVVLALFLALRPLRLQSPASPGARAMVRLDHALGATVEPVNSAIARKAGLASVDGYLVVTSVANKGPGASAGLRVGDVIEEIGDRRGAGMIDATATGTAPVAVRRQGKDTIVNVQFASSTLG